MEYSFFRRLYKERTGYLFILPQFILFFAFMIYPIMSGFKMSLYKINLNNKVFVGFENFRRLFEDPNFVKSISNTLLFVVTIVALAVVFGVIVSAAVFDKASQYVSFVRVCYYIPVAVSMVVMTVVWSFLFDPSQGLINYVLSLLGHDPVNFLGDSKLVMPVIIFVTFVSNIGQVIVLYVASMIGIPVEICEAVEVDGATKFQRFFYIILPLVKTTTLFVVINETISIMKIFVVIQLMTNGGPNYASSTLMYFLYDKAFKLNGKMGEAAAVGVIMFLFCLAFSVVQFRFLGSDEKSKKQSRRKLA